MYLSDALPYEGDMAELADYLFEIGAVKFGVFPLKLHETQPDAPLSPIFFNLRTANNPKPGPLDSKALKLIGRVLAKLVVEGSTGGFERIARIPNAGDPIAIALQNTLSDLHLPSPLLWLEKAEESGMRKISGVRQGEWYNRADRVLVVDDLITQAGTKIEAIDVLENIANQAVHDLIVLIDRQQGGRKQVEARGVNVTAAFELDKLLSYYVVKGNIAADKAV